jgi:nitroreductase
MRVWAHKTTALACENYMLAMRAHGYDTCPMEGFDEVKIRRVLQLPSDAEVTMVISAGKRAKDGVYGPRVRFERELFIKEI